MTMTLYWSSRSPFARKAMLAAHERGVAAQLVLVPKVVSILQGDAPLAAINPLGQIPTLVLEGGVVLYDALTICEYFDTIGAATPAPLFPVLQPARGDALRRHALGQGMTEALVRQFGERRRLDALQADYVRAFQDKFLRGADACEAGIAARDGAPADIGDLALACALAYADFRFDDIGWRGGRPRLAAWYAAFAQRPSMLATAFAAA